MRKLEIDEGWAGDGTVEAQQSQPRADAQDDATRRNENPGGCGACKAKSRAIAKYGMVAC